MLRLPSDWHSSGRFAVLFLADFSLSLAAESRPRMGNNRFLIFLASFMTLIAAGMGFGIRGKLLGPWSEQYGFTQTELGLISGGGLVGFGLIIIAVCLFVDRIGYKPLMGAAFVAHLLSAILTFSATPVFNAYGKDATFYCLSAGMWLFAIGNGLCEASINPLVATLYPNKKTHYLNILHAGWPAGLVLGALCGMLAGKVQWEILLGLFLVPTVIYGAITLSQRFPVPESRAAGVSVGEMFATLASPILLFLFFLHACVGYVELGTDSWIQNITDNILVGQGTYLFIYASTIMFILRFFAGPIVEKINPIGLLAVSALCGCIGLYLISIGDQGWWIWVAVTIYGVGKTFLWPTMLGVIGERYPKGGSLAMGITGGLGMLSAGALGVPIIGYQQDYYASAQLKEDAPAAYERYEAEKENELFGGALSVRGLDGQKKGVLLDDAKTLTKEVKIFKDKGLYEGPTTPEAIKAESDISKNARENLKSLESWWTTTGEPNAAADKPAVGGANTYGGRMALQLTAFVPAFLAASYLLLWLYFAATGGYKQEHLHREDEQGEEYTGGTEGPMQA